MQEEHISSKEAQNNFGMLLDTAQRVPVIIKRHKRDCAVMISMQEYQILKKARLDALFSLQKQIAQEAEDNGMTEQKLQEILNDDGDDSEYYH